MTPPDATTARPSRPSRLSGGGPAHRRTASRPPRRVSGPAGGVRAARAAIPVPAGGAPGSVAVAPPLALRLARRAARVGDARLLDRLVRGRGWIALVAVGLMGIVFVQVSMLRLNAGISRAVASAETLERQNSILRADISELDAAQRISDTASALGMVRPPAGDVNYLDARKANGAAAAKAVRPPQPVADASAAARGQQEQAGTATQPTTPAQSAPTATTAQSTAPTQPSQPTATAPSQTVAPQTAPTQTAPAPQTQTQTQTQTQPQAEAAATATPGAP